MSDNLDKRRPQDGSKINVNEDWELRYWTNKLNVSADALKNAVKKVGTSASAVKQHLKNNKPEIM